MAEEQSSAITKRNCGWESRLTKAAPVSNSTGLVKHARKRGTSPLQCASVILEQSIVGWRSIMAEVVLEKLLEVALTWQSYTVPKVPIDTR